MISQFAGTVDLKHNMDIGDLIQYKDQRWMVISFERETRLMTLYSLKGSKCEIPRDYDKTHRDELKVLANPSKQWKLLTAKVRTIGAGPFVRIVDPAPMGQKERSLVPMVDWVPSDLGRSGGSFFVNPEVNLLPGTVLIATHKNGTAVRIQVPKTFGTMAQRKAMSEAIKQAAVKVIKRDPNRFSRILESDD
jgi:hypothetical protein